MIELGKDFGFAPEAASRSTSRANWAGSTLTATSRLSFVSRAR
jgi:hypothetical protein